MDRKAAMGGSHAAKAATAVAKEAPSKAIFVFSLSDMKGPRGMHSDKLVRGAG